VTATDSEGKHSLSKSISETSNKKPDPPEPTVHLSRGNPVTKNDCSINCYYFKVKLEEFSPSSSFRIQCYNTKSGSRHKFSTSTGTLIRTNSAGEAKGQAECYHGAKTQKEPLYAKVDGVWSQAVTGW
ncbi:hypothetical protein, partial [Arthrobacter rhombi]